MMNPGLAHTIESLFGPPSEKIDLSDFVESSSPLLLGVTDDQKTFPDDIVQECSVSDIHRSLENTWSNPMLSAHLINDHDRMVSALHALHPSVKLAKSSKKSNLPDPDTLSVEATMLQKNLDAISINSFRLKADAILFLRTTKNSDKNIIRNIKATKDSSSTAGRHEAVLLISIHKKVTWGPSYVARASQHAFISSQTLQDVHDAILCESQNLHREADLSEGSSGCCIEGVFYGKSRDIADKLVELLSSLPRKNSTPFTSAPTSQKDTKLRSLSFRINEPYWFIHHGNCEHFIVVDQIRLLHPWDPASGYPLTLRVAPSILDICRACGKIPAMWSVLADIRLGESPCLLCGPCWKTMGESNDKQVTVLPITLYM